MRRRIDDVSAGCPSPWPRGERPPVRCGSGLNRKSAAGGGHGSASIGGRPGARSPGATGSAAYTSARTAATASTARTPGTPGRRTRVGVGVGEPPQRQPTGRRQLPADPGTRLGGRGDRTRGGTGDGDAGRAWDGARNPHRRSVTSAFPSANPDGDTGPHTGGPAPHRLDATRGRPAPRGTRGGGRGHHPGRGRHPRRETGTREPRVIRTERRRSRVSQAPSSEEWRRLRTLGLPAGSPRTAQRRASGPHGGRAHQKHTLTAGEALNRGRAQATSRRQASPPGGPGSKVRHSPAPPRRARSARRRQGEARHDPRRATATGPASAAARPVVLVARPRMPAHRRAPPLRSRGTFPRRRQPDSRESPFIVWSR